MTEEIKLYGDPLELACTLPGPQLSERIDGALAELIAGAEETTELRTDTNCGFQALPNGPGRLRSSSWSSVIAVPSSPSS